MSLHNQDLKYFPAQCKSRSPARAADALKIHSGQVILAAMSTYYEFRPARQDEAMRNGWSLRPSAVG